MGAEQSVGDRYKTHPADRVSKIAARYEMGPTPQNMHLFNPSAGIAYNKPKPAQQRPTAGAFAPGVFAAPQHHNVSNRIAEPRYPQRPTISPTETERSESDMASLAGSETGGSGSPTIVRHGSDPDDLVRSNSSKSAVEEAAEAAAAAGVIKRSSEERSAARAAFVEHLKNMQAYAEKKGVEPKQWRTWESVQTGKDAYKMGRYDVVRTQLLGHDVAKADACASVSYYRGIDEELAMQDPALSGEVVVEC